MMLATLRRARPGVSGESPALRTASLLGPAPPHPARSSTRARVVSEAPRDNSRWVPETYLVGPPTRRFQVPAWPATSSAEQRISSAFMTGAVDIRRAASYAKSGRFSSPATRHAAAATSNDTRPQRLHQVSFALQSSAASADLSVQHRASPTTRQHEALRAPGCTSELTTSCAAAASSINASYQRLARRAWSPCHARAHPSLNRQRRAVNRSPIDSANCESLLRRQEAPLQGHR